MIVPVLVGIGCGVIAGLIDGSLIAYARIPSFIATLGMMVAARGLSRWWSKGNSISFPPESYAAIGKGMMPVLIFILLFILFRLIMNYTKYDKHYYAIGSNEEAACITGIKVEHHKVLVCVIAGVFASIAAILLSSKNLAAQAGMGVMYELDAIAMAVIGGVSLSGGLGSIMGTVLDALIFGAIIVGAIVLDQWPQRRRSLR